MDVVKRGEVWLVTLDPTVGSEIRKTRPCLIVSPDELNRGLQTVIIAPMTTGSRPSRFRVPIVFGGTSGLILPDQVRTVSKKRLVKRLGGVQRSISGKALSALQRMFEH